MPQTHSSVPIQIRLLSFSSRPSPYSFGALKNIQIISYFYLIFRVLRHEWCWAWRGGFRMRITSVLAIRYVNALCGLDTAIRANHWTLDSDFCTKFGISPFSAFSLFAHLTKSRRRQDELKTAASFVKNYDKSWWFLLQETVAPHVLDCPSHYTLLAVSKSWFKTHLLTAHIVS